MSVNVTDIQDYLDWKMQQNLAGVRDSVEDFAKYREQLDRDARVEETLEYLITLIESNTEFSVGSIRRVYRVLTGVEYEPDDV